MKLLLVPLLVFGFAGHAAAIEWPADYELVAGTESPGGQYGILAVKLPGADPSNFDSNKFYDELETNYLADLKAHTIIGSITGISFPDMAHGGGLKTSWAADRSWCLACYDGKWGFRSVKLLTLTQSGAKETDLGEAIQATADKVAKTSLLLKAEPATNGGALSITAIGTDNPKEFPDVSSHYVIFSGTYDPAAGKWLTSTAHAGSKRDYDKMADSPENGSPTVTGDDQKSRSNQLDLELNQVYQQLKASLPAAKFTEVQAAQREWLTGTGNAVTATAENDRTEARVAELRKLLASNAGNDQQARRAHLDEELNQVYRMIKASWPADQFAHLTVAQREWLEGAGKASTPQAENDRTAARIAVLRKLSKVSGDAQEIRRAELDAELNSVYQELKATDSPEAFSKVVTAQREWLTGAGHASSAAAENDRTEARVRELRGLLKAAKH